MKIPSIFSLRRHVREISVGTPRKYLALTVTKWEWCEEFELCSGCQKSHPRKIQQATEVMLWLPNGHCELWNRLGNYWTTICRSSKGVNS